MALLTVVTIEDMMAAREKRSLTQKELCVKYNCPLVSYTLNIAGPVKRFKNADRCFYEGKQEIEKYFAHSGFTIYECVLTNEASGLECIWAIAADDVVLKKAMAHIEEQHPLGRLFDIDVISEGGEKIMRKSLNLPLRSCLVCGKSGHECARCLNHPLEEILKNTNIIIDNYFFHLDAETISRCAIRALLYELSVTPKPGLVDRHNNGAHKDMDFFSFIDSTVTLIPYFHDMALAGMKNRRVPLNNLLAQLRRRGLQAENEMLAATGGINTHKGIIFSLGIICVSCGYLELSSALMKDIFQTASAIASPALETDFQGITQENARTNGEMAFAKHNSGGIRAEAAGGFPSVREHAMPAFEKAIKRGYSLEDSGLHALLHLLANVEDTNIISRSSFNTLFEIQQNLRVFLKNHPDEKAVREYAFELDKRFCELNISPGGCADLLVITYMMHFIGEQFTARF